MSEKTLNLILFLLILVFLVCLATSFYSAAAGAGGGIIALLARKLKKSRRIIRDVQKDLEKAKQKIREGKDEKNRDRVMRRYRRLSREDLIRILRQRFGDDAVRDENDKRK